jgi:two-component system, response regulator YesN
MYQLVIIDDEPIIVEGLTNAIDWEGYHIHISLASTDPVYALDFILEHDVNIVITDISMPTLNGLTLIQKIKAVRPSTYVIVLSAFGNFEYTKTALRSGAENYLLKPLDMDELSDTISQIISHIKEREELNSIYGHSMLTFRSAFTEQWLKNLLSSNEFYAKAELLGINLSATNYTVLIFSNRDKNSSVMSKFLDFLLAKIIGTYSANFYFETPYRLVCVISPVENNKKSFSEFIDQLLNSIRLRRYNIFISIGSQVDNFSKVSTSYNEANFISYLEHTHLSHSYFNVCHEFMEEVEYALTNYINIEIEKERFIRNLYQKYSAYDCTLQLLCKVLNNLCKNVSEFQEKYPALIEQMKKLPTIEADNEVLFHYTLNFLNSIQELMIKTQQSMYPIVESAIKIINNFTDKDISLKTLSQKLNVTPSYLGTLFHQQTGYYFNDYLSESRLKYAAQLLEESDLKVKDIVDKIGFSSQTYFNRAFKRYFNTSPVNFRRDKKVEQLNRKSL